MYVHVCMCMYMCVCYMHTAFHIKNRALVSHKVSYDDSHPFSYLLTAPQTLWGC